MAVQSLSVSHHLEDLAPVRKDKPSRRTILRAGCRVLPGKRGQDKGGGGRRSVKGGKSS